MRENLMANVDVFAAGYEDAIQEEIDRLESMQFSERLWRRDPGLWKDEPEQRRIISNALGWLNLPVRMESNQRTLTDFTAELLNSGFEHVVHIGMGGSSLAPLVLQHMFGPRENGLPLTILDTTDPATVLDVERRVPLAKTLFIEASKSGATVESRALGEYFYNRVKEIKGNLAGENMAVITDPGSTLAQIAEGRRYRRILTNFPDVGGRYSALSYFGLVPAALMGIDVSELLHRARLMSAACEPGVPILENPGVFVGAVLGALAGKGRDKVTFFAIDTVATLGMWLEQLIAESTGKEGTGLLPVSGEPPGDPSVYGNDRMFVHFRLDGEPDASLDRGVEALKNAGHPVITIKVWDRMDISQELYRWEIATAAAGAVLGINPFDQPNVQETKSLTDNLLREVREGRKPHQGRPPLTESPLEIYGDVRGTTPCEAISAFFAEAPEGAYAAFLAYLSEAPDVNETLENMRLLVRDKFRVATTLGYGPRYLHSTGQLHKGGANKGLFIIFTANDHEDIPIPGEPYTFGTLRRAQALGDFAALRARGRRVIRVHLGDDKIYGLELFRKAMLF